LQAVYVGCSSSGSSANNNEADDDDNNAVAIASKKRYMIVVGDKAVKRNTILGMILRAHGDKWGIAWDWIVEMHYFLIRQKVNQEDYLTDL
jgi:hypothetical protein